MEVLFYITESYFFATAISHRCVVVSLKAVGLTGESGGVYRPLAVLSMRFKQGDGVVMACQTRGRTVFTGGTHTG